MHLEEGRSVNSLTKEYGLGAGSLNSWVKKYREECKQTNRMDQSNQEDVFDQLAQLRKQNEELEKENRFLKKAAAFFAKETEK
ncbi:transposase [Thermoactinomyces sp. DSM 45891]|nr:transposase [Thermoactinomyces sp. DSM 45891]